MDLSGTGCKPKLTGGILVYLYSECCEKFSKMVELIWICFIEWLSDVWSRFKMSNN